MDFIDVLKQFSAKVSQTKDKCTNEASTKLFLINPFLRLMGYDTTDPDDVWPEFTADVGIKQGEKVDYAILQKGDPVILIEAKQCGNDLSGDHGQLLRYFHGTTAKFGILTNGIVYKFYTDLEQPNRMDTKPFLELDLLNIKETIVPEIKRFCKSNFNADEIFSSASELKYSNEIKAYFAAQLKEPDDDFIKYILTHIYDGVKTQSIIDKFKPIIRHSLNNYVSELMNDKITTALRKSNADEIKSEADDTEEIVEKKIDPSPKELEAFYVIRTLIGEKIRNDDITYRPTQSYLNILYKNNVRKWICRLKLENNNPCIIVPSENPNGTVILLADGINSLYEQKQILLDSLNKYIDFTRTDNENNI